MRKLVAIVVCILLISAITIPVLAAENANTVVGELVLFAVNEGEIDNFDIDTGHAFLLFVNTSESSKIIGVYTVPAGGSVTFGTWPGGSKHDGIWYNLECYAHHSKDMFNNRVSLSTVVTQNDLTNINALIATNDEYNLLSDNCVDFALEIWYNVDDYYSFSTGHPSSPNQLLNSIKTITEHEINRAIPSNTRVGYASNGAFVQVSNSDLSDLIDKLYVDDSEIMSEESHPQQSF